MTQMRREISNLLANPCLPWFEYSCLITMFFVSVGVISQIAGLSVSSTSFLQWNTKCLKVILFKLFLLEILYICFLSHEILWLKITVSALEQQYESNLYKNAHEPLQQGSSSSVMNPVTPPPAVTTTLTRWWHLTGKESEPDRYWTKRNQRNASQITFQSTRVGF